MSLKLRTKHLRAERRCARPRIYDAEGNLTSETNTSTGQVTQYTWDYRNRLTQEVVKSSSGVTITNEQFTYDVNNLRIGFDVNGTQTWTVWDRGNPYADFNGSGSLQYVYLYGEGLDALMARFDGTTAMFYLTDALGSVRQDVYVSGTVRDAITYDAFGNILTETSPSSGDRFKYTGREYDSATGLQYNRARYYDGTDGRWISQDPLGLGLSGRSAASACCDSHTAEPPFPTNLYLYASDDPANLVDPTGLEDYTPQLRNMGCVGWANIGIDNKWGVGTRGPSLPEFAPAVICFDTANAAESYQADLALRGITSVLFARQMGTKKKPAPAPTPIRATGRVPPGAVAPPRSHTEPYNYAVLNSDIPFFGRSKLYWTWANSANNPNLPHPHDPTDPLRGLPGGFTQTIWCVRVGYSPPNFFPTASPDTGPFP